ncbi:MAG: ribosomal-protein-alanine N-acetyltransferase [Clostridia bacterium]|jgi:ribosomal-protein-alanine N-acetyltransferase|nr:ribosomal protein S18-alanine N-acetyltransferase [Lachnospiraceae bacterium]NCC01526.1 ribosomal-protein-alanine N-acetyltransferase [Clostridia bacterium]NCD03320.1 ribosomal-protein-alanine N-acetyltransferase [Clostridia bacterium]
MIIRKMTFEDLERVVTIENQCFTDPWSKEGFADSLKQESSELITAENDEGEIVGYCCLYFALDEGEIVNVAVAPECRKKGYGAWMVRRLMDIGIEKGVRQFFLEVRASNEAGQKLYNSLGFEVCGMRKGFYTQPKEDAVLMTWSHEA